jgi:hypothetical protein
LDHSFKNQWINIPSISKQLMADPLFRNQGQKLAGGVPDQLQLSAENGGVGKQKKNYLKYKG